MQGRPENFNPAGEDPEATLVTPRFDEEEARRAHPVVPLAEAPARASYTHAPRARRVRGARRSWMPALLAVGLLVVAAVGGAITTQVMRSPRAQQAQEQTQAAPVQTAEAPPQPSTPVTAEAPREEAPAVSPPPRNARTRRARAATTLAAEPGRGAADDDEDEELREIREEIRREREKEMRKAFKRAKEQAKDKAPRLVDVLTPSP
jgi:hypothetical protein